MKRCLAFLLVVLLCMSTMFSACGSSVTTKDKQADKNEEIGTGIKTDTGKGYTLSAPGQYPIVDKPVTLKVFQAAHPYVENYETNYAENGLKQRQMFTLIG